MSIRPSSLGAALSLLLGAPALGALPSSAALDDAAYTLGLCSRHLGRGPADTVLARYNAAHPMGREERARINQTFNEIYRRGQGEGGRAPIEYGYCNRQVAAILKKFGG